MKKKKKINIIFNSTKNFNLTLKKEETYLFTFELFQRKIFLYESLHKVRYSRTRRRRRREKNKRHVPLLLVIIIEKFHFFFAKKKISMFRSTSTQVKYERKKLKLKKKTLRSIQLNFFVNNDEFIN